jgi:voltage-gated potassium channel
MALIRILSLNFVAILIFTLIYFTISKVDKEQFNGLDKESSFLDHLYFAFTVQSTVGFGDIYPISPIAKILVMVQQALLILGVLELISEAAPVVAKNVRTVPTMMTKMM